MEPGWYTIIVTPDDGTHIYYLGADYDIEAFTPLLTATKAAHGVPDGWIDLGAGWDVSLTDGPLHPKLLARPGVVLHDTLPDTA